MNSLGKVMSRKSALALIGALLICALIMPAMPPSPALANGEVSVDLLVTGSKSDEIINVANYSVPSGTITEDGITVDKQTAMGTLICYCQENTIEITVTDTYGSPYVQQIGANLDDDSSWMYAYNKRTSMVNAANQAVGDNDSVHWFNYTLGYYQLLLALDKTKISQGENITATVNWTDGTGTTLPVENASVYVSDTMGAYQPEPGTLTGNTNASGELTFTWDTVGQFWPYAEIDTRTSISQYPTPTFECYSFIVSLSPGWNLISTPKKLTDGHRTVQQVFGSVDTGGHSIWLYDASASSPWGTGMAANDNIEPLDGIWIYSAGPDEIYLIFNTDPRTVPPTKLLGAGWNAIGFSDTTGTSANSTLMSVESQWAYIIGFDAANQQYEASIINDTADGDHAETRAMLPGKGYWIYMTASKELAGISG